ncbi:hybrid sensor histidine kinase/response regulator [Magnetospirillum molischianum]|uniref:histidine kinase n=1 Tax=Magnetospirillum molischianum DSM 120 TaxID=1150626 RepID=H8FMR6_MAGML|nr:PAS domain-containing sensor histidine kinase [Magnetospirillum molischianum]CCG39654.1 Putative two-component sensor histidine kinase with multiple PAS domains and a CheY-like response regulator receiver domain [Magnetospirillum molischianum DSM 120]
MRTDDSPVPASSPPPAAGRLARWWSRLTRRRPTPARLAAALAAALEEDGRAVLVVGADGKELFRNRAGHRLLGGAADPLATLKRRAGGDERASAGLERLEVAARLGAPRRAEIGLPQPMGRREWLALEVRPGDSPGGLIWIAEDVSGRRAIVETLRRENERLSDFVDYLPVGCYSADANGTVRYVNQRLADWLGRTDEKLVGHSLDDLLGSTPNPEEERSDLRFKGRSGEVFQGMIAHSVFDEGGEMFTRSVVVRDPLPEQHLERAVRAAERRFRWLFDDAPVGIALVDPDGTLSGCNLALQAMLGIDRNDMIGHPIADLIAEESRAGAVDQLGRVMQGSLPGTHLDVRLAGKRAPIAQLFVSPSHEDNDINGLVIHFIDATEQRNLELQFAQSQKMQAMGQLAGGVAHDFNNLLTAMIGFCDLLLQRHGVGDPSFADIMQVKQNANRAAALVRQLLAFSRRQALQPRRLAVTDALADLSTLLRRLLGETIELKMIHGRALGLIRVDPGQFDQVIINLAVNARDAMPGGGTLTIRTNAVLVDQPVQRGPELMPPGDYVLIEIADTGTGIGRDTLPRIFEPFFSTKEIGAGTGLGLSTVYGIVRQTDGFIFVNSEPGQGATFSIYLPRIDGEPAAESAVEPRRVIAEESPSPTDLTGSGTILLAEDEDAVRLFGARALRNKGYTVIEARSGEQAAEFLRGPNPIDLLISDVVMPGMDGVTLAGLARTERPQVRVILISGYSEDVARDGIGPDAGFAFLPKPFSLAQLAGAVKQALTDRNTER